MRTFRVFVSSPADVQAERDRARVVIARVQTHFHGRVRMVSALWEDAPLEPTKTFQDGIDEKIPLDQIDIAVFIFWGRLGTRLLGKKYGGRTGCEWEFEQARVAFVTRRMPDMLVYRRTTEPVLPLLARDGRRKVKQAADQYGALCKFFERWFQNDKRNAFTAAFHPYGSPDGFEELLERHLRQLVADRLARGTDVGPAWTDGSPFRGLAVFDVRHAPVFCGRARVTHEALHTLRRQSSLGRAFLLILGASGSGKSSLARAGLLAQLHAPNDVEPDAPPGFVVRAIMRPGDGSTPFDSLVSALTHAFGGASGGESARSDLATAFRESPVAAVAFVKERLGILAAERTRTHNSDIPLVARLALLVDQMEELFTRDASTPVERSAFGRVMTALARSGVVWVVATLRADFYGRLGEVPELAAMKGETGGQVDVFPPTPGEIAEMVRVPAEAAGLLYERHHDTLELLDNTLIDACAGHPASLPLLQFTLDALYEKRHGVTLTWQSYEAMGGLEGALADRAEATFRGLEPGVQEALPLLIRSLVDIGASEDLIATKRRPLRGDLDRDPACAALVDALVAARLLESGTDLRDRPVVGVAHEALLRSWPRFRTLIELDREAIQLRSRIAHEAAHYASRGRDPDLLLPEGLALRDGQRLLGMRFLDLDDLTRGYIEASLGASRLRAQEARAEAEANAREHSRLRDSLRAIGRQIELDRLAVSSTYAPTVRRAEVARREEEHAEGLARAERLVEASRVALERAARIEIASGEMSQETRAAFADFYMERWRDALERGDDTHSKLAREQVESFDRERRAHARELEGLATLRVEVEQTDATAHLFRYESYERVRTEPRVVPRLVPVPATQGDGSGTAAERAGSPGTVPDFLPGDLCLVVTDVAPGSVGAEAHLRVGDLVVRIGGEPCGEGLVVSGVAAGGCAHSAGIEPHHRIALLDGEPVEGWYDLRTARLRDVPPGAASTLTVVSGGRRRDLEFSPERGLESLGLTLTTPAELLSQPRPVSLCLECLCDGVPRKLDVPAGTDLGIRVERTAYPLICSQENLVTTNRDVTVQPGSYLLLIRAPGKEKQRCHFVVQRLGRVVVKPRLLEIGTTPDGFIHVPPGPFLYGGDPAALQSAPVRTLFPTEDLFIARRAVTYGEWFDFVNSPLTLERIRAAKARGEETPYLPRNTLTPKKYARLARDGTYALEDVADAPVLGISWTEVRDYLEWRNARQDDLTCQWRLDLPTEEEWEHAARGADGRFFPWGNRFDFSLCVGGTRKWTPLFDLPGGFEPRDESPYGVWDMGGSRWHWTREEFAPGSGTYSLRGGSWGSRNSSLFRSAARGDVAPSFTYFQIGFRVVARSRTSAEHGASGREAIGGTRT